MGTVNIRVDEILEDILKKLQVEINKEVNSKFPKLNVDLPSTVTSRVAAARLRGEGKLTFRVKKTGLNKGFIEIL